MPLKDVTALHQDGGGSQPTDAQEKAAAGKAKARELGEKTFLSFKERRLRFRCPLCRRSTANDEHSLREQCKRLGMAFEWIQQAEQ